MQQKKHCGSYNKTIEQSCFKLCNNVGCDVAKLLQLECFFKVNPSENIASANKKAPTHLRVGALGNDLNFDDLKMTSKSNDIF
jgi:hypothetical protein